MKRTPLKRRRSKPRRGRTEDPERIDWAAGIPCQVSGEFPATTHHVRHYGSPKDDTEIIRLAARLHQKTAFDYDARIPCVEDGKKVFEEFHGVSIEKLVRELQERYAQQAAIPVRGNGLGAQVN